MMNWHCGSRVLDLSRRTMVMGIVNVTPDSFSDGGQFSQVGQAIEHGLQLAEEGADILDIGGESTRPGSDPVPIEVELQRVLPVIKELHELLPDTLISIDTNKAPVALQAIALGADIVNDITALRGDPRMAAIVAETGAGLVLMHMLGISPKTMQQTPQYGDVMAEVMAFLRERMVKAAEAGIAPEQLALDPGIGFGKTLAHNLEIIRRLDELASLGRPVLMGPSRKAFLGRLLNLPPDQRLEGTAAAVTASVLAGARIVRVHDVLAMVRVVRIADAIAGRGEIPA